MVFCQFARVIFLNFKGVRKYLRGIQQTSGLLNYHIILQIPLTKNLSFHQWQEITYGDRNKDLHDDLNDDFLRTQDLDDDVDFLPVLGDKDEDTPYIRLDVPPEAKNLKVCSYEAYQLNNHFRQKNIHRSNRSIKSNSKINHLTILTKRHNPIYYKSTILVPRYSLSLYPFYFFSIH